MNGFGEGVGIMVEGGLLGHAVEPHGVSKTSSQPGEIVTCANCKALYQGHFCPECGQKAHIHRSLAAIGHDIMHGVLHLDGKLWTTLPLLAFKPGELTRRYVAGERAKFVSPMAMFLFSVFAMFAVFQMVGISAPTDLPTNIDASDSPFRDRIEEQITALERERDTLSRGDPRKGAIDSELTGLNVLLSREVAKSGGDGDDLNMPLVEWLGEGVVAKWKKNPGLMLYKLQANGYKFSWLLIPLSLPFMWLMFAWRRQFKAYDHAVFVTYSLSFMSLLFIVMSLISTLPGGGNWASTLFVIAAPLHLYKQLRYAYRLSRPSAIWRFGVLLLSTSIVLLLFAQVLLLLGAF